MTVEEAVSFLVEHAAKVDAELAEIKETLATKNELREIRTDIREGTAAMRHFVTYTEHLLNAVTKGQMSLEARVETLDLEITDLKRRIADLEKRNPAA
jgi:hypothetical protein